ncbi:MAG: hypothetical protein LKJ48_01680 [Lactobacillus sp.]|nr:hypothetical protein [Lactobacillus sp.]
MIVWYDNVQSIGEAHDENTELDPARRRDQLMNLQGAGHMKRCRRNHR